ncbi:unnamed protein product [Lepeophtheirus salmonis]|uniref:(salmon louse) hypothetical protein n=1 Tax=Lepeophtheirus salmonis TaxID=72036 RepID=A0A7R8CL39_LEPSM|nr:unnamed protein product [Lepeophtheirus salmonis]CAF2852371.1 unnamed protein product [Lepeophtheirus salmonis]
MSGKQNHSEWEILKSLHPSSYSESGEEDIGISSDDENIQPPCSSSKEDYTLQEMVVTDRHKSAPPSASYTSSDRSQNDPCPANQSMLSHVVFTLIEPFAGYGRNGTTKNIITSLILSKQQKESLEP